MAKQFIAHTQWQAADGTANMYYDRTHEVSIAGKPPLTLTTANPLRGDAAKLNPEDLLVAAVSSCHMLSYLYLCAAEGIVVVAYEDEAIGHLKEVGEDSAVFTRAVLNPVVTVASADMVERATALHHKAHGICIIANSVNFEVVNNPVCKVKQ